MAILNKSVFYKAVFGYTFEGQTVEELTAPQNLAVHFNENPGDDLRFSWTRSSGSVISYQYELYRIDQPTGLYTHLVTSGSWVESDLTNEGGSNVSAVMLRSRTGGSQDKQFKLRAYDGTEYSDWASIIFNMRLGTTSDTVIIHSPLFLIPQGVIFSDKSTLKNYDKVKIVPPEEPPIHLT